MSVIWFHCAIFAVAICAAGVVKLLIALKELEVYSFFRSRRVMSQAEAWRDV